jgi:hypothetical protein
MSKYADKFNVGNKWCLTKADWGFLTLKWTIIFFILYNKTKKPGSYILQPGFFLIGLLLVFRKLVPSPRS